MKLLTGGSCQRENAVDGVETHGGLGLYLPCDVFQKFMRGTVQSMTTTVMTCAEGVPASL